MSHLCLSLTKSREWLGMGILEIPIFVSSHCLKLLKRFSRKIAFFSLSTNLSSYHHPFRMYPQTSLFEISKPLCKVHAVIAVNIVSPCPPSHSAVSLSLPRYALTRDLAKCADSTGICTWDRCTWFTADRY